MEERSGSHVSWYIDFKSPAPVVGVMRWLSLLLLDCHAFREPRRAEEDEVSSGWFRENIGCCCC